MVFYRFEIRIIEPSDEIEELLKLDLSSREKTRKIWAEQLCNLNENMQRITENCETDYVFIAYKVKERSIYASAGCNDYDNPSEALSKIIKANCFDSKVEMEHFTEITGKQFMTDLNGAYEIDCVTREVKDVIEEQGSVDYNNNYHFSVNERVVVTSKHDEKTISERAAGKLVDHTLKEEVKRIYSDMNVRGYYGNPVHYYIKADSTEEAYDIIKILVSSLYSVGRLLSGRVSIVSAIDESCYDEEDLEKLFKCASGSIVVIETMGSDEEHGNYASSFTEVVEYYAKLINKYYQQTLFCFVELREHPSFGESLRNSLTSAIRMVDLEEGKTASRTEALYYLQSLAAKDRISKVAICNYSQLLEDRQYSATELNKKYEEWHQKAVSENVYPAYKNIESVAAKESEIICDAYEELKRMVGLSEIKVIIEDIIATAKIQKIRTIKGLKTQNMSYHMVFTGSPGTAKTTVARSIAKILKEEGILRTGTFIECGRQDLVAKYVGWSAKQVETKFKQAYGGILFIDEAYSLLDDSHSFGEEAINTIVQLMENYRNDVIVIFAGYPDKMKHFLNSNEGLRSRVAFHLHFPDYDEEELSEILELMAEGMGYTISNEAKSKCRNIFKKARTVSDYGNGRYVRNKLEQAIMKQASRLTHSKKITQDQLTLLLEEDFCEDELVTDERKKRKYGFI